MNDKGPVRLCYDTSLVQRYLFQELGQCHAKGLVKTSGDYFPLPS
jgi:hypothetical protein